MHEEEWEVASGILPFPLASVLVSDDRDGNLDRGGDDNATFDVVPLLIGGCAGGNAGAVDGMGGCMLWRRYLGG